MKNCKICGELVKLPPFHRSVCRACLGKRRQKWGAVIDPTTGLTNAQLSCKRHKDSGQDKSAKHRKFIKSKVIGHYTNETFTCTCCGEYGEQFLTIDHIVPVSQGHSIAPPTKRGGSNLYGWLAANNFPNGFRVLCFNCNVGRYINGGLCPHEARKNESAA